ncbi:MAG: hypothetical protein NVS3B21_02920 [Acidimicrobiales bacterium]
MWHHLEVVNAVTYFSAECVQAQSDLGLRGFWMGYFAARAAPMGAVEPGVVEATFFNFHPTRVRRAIPAAWSLARPDQVLLKRESSAATALRRVLSDAKAEDLAAAALADLRAVVAAAGSGGRPLFAANRDVVTSDDPVGSLWQAATTLREHRGDGHVGLLQAAELDGCEAHVLFAATEGVASQLFLESRGWSGEEWRAATERLARRNLVTAEGLATETGHRLRQDLEARTDELAMVPYLALRRGAVDGLIEVLRGPVQKIAMTEIRFPNPMGLPPPGQGASAP